MSKTTVQLEKWEQPRHEREEAVLRNREGRPIRRSRSLFLYIFWGLAVNWLIAFVVLEVVQGIIFTIRATEGYSFDFLIIFPVLLRAFGQAITYTLPIALLFGTGLFVGRLNADREILAMQSFGLSSFQLLLPVAALGGLAGLASYFINNQWVPGMRFANRNVGTFILDQLGYLGEGWNLEFNTGSMSLWIYHCDGPVLDGVFLSISESASGTPISAEVLSKVDTVSYPIYLFAERGFALRGKGDQEGRLVVELGGVSIFFDHDLLDRKASSNFMQRAHFERPRWVPRLDVKSPSVKDLDSGDLERETEKRLAELRQVEEQGSSEDIEAARRQYSSAVTEFHRRLSLSLSALTFPLCAFVLGLFVLSSNRLLPFFLSSTIVPAFYFTFELAGNNLSKKGMPWVLEHLGNGVLVLLCVGLLWRIHRGPRR